MSILSYLQGSFARKRARRIYQQYGTRVDLFRLKNGETVEFANWLNPLIQPKEITQSEIDFFRKYMAPGSLGIDIGANIGDKTVPMAIAAGADGLVLGVDPNPTVFKVLEANARLNAGRANIVPLQLAATETRKQFYFASSEASMSNGGLIENPNDPLHGKFKHKDPIQGVNLAEYLEEFYPQWLPKLSFIKLDAEGWDYFILKTLIPIVKKYRPTIAMEVYHRISAQTRSDMFSLLKEFNYTILNIGTFEGEINADPTPIESLEQMPPLGHTENIVAFQP
ncbi:MAG TPA: FkbM family methyltransferase [Puia sp.]|nr:FkbM family methyltransferase [Puia sp.]